MYNRDHHRYRDEGPPEDRPRRRSRERGRDRDRDRNRGNDYYRDEGRRRGHSPSSYDAEYESRRFRDRRERDVSDRYDRRRSRSRESRESRRHEERDHRNRDSRRQNSHSEDSSSRDYESRGHKQHHMEATEKRPDESQQPSQREKTQSDEFLAKMSDEKLQESFDRYEADPSYTMTDGLLDNIVIDKEKIQAEMQERLRQHLLAEGKVYPPPKPEPPPQTTAFANDGSFLDMFKKMQEQQQQQQQGTGEGSSSSGVTVGVAKSSATTEVKRPVGPMFGKRRGGKILKTGIVEKKKPIEDLSADAAPGDAWSQYMKEVKRYKAVSCDTENKNRPLVK